MKKIVKVLVALVASLFVSSAAFADDFDWSQTWCNFGGGIEPGHVIVDAGIGVPIRPVVPMLGGYSIPSVEASVEVPVKIGPCPFSFGGAVAWNMYGYKEWYTVNAIDVTALAKYHFMFPPKQLDLYAGMKLGVSLNFQNLVGYNSTSFLCGFYGSGFIGASWYFTDAFGVNLEIGAPTIIRAGVSFKF